MAFLLLMSTLLLLPGLMITYLLNLDKYRFLLSFSLSYTLFIILFKSVPFLGLDVTAFKCIYFFIIFILLFLSLFKYYRTNKNATNPYVVKFHSWNRCSVYVPAIIIGSVAAYLLTVGAYVELPSDVFSHLEYMQQVTSRIQLSESRGIPITAYLGQNGRYWQYLYSLLAMWSGLSLQDAILPASFFNISVFLLGVFWFSQTVFRDMGLSTRMLVFSSVVAVFFTFFHFGVNIFSFVRYYAIAPAILNFVLYFSIMAIVIDFFREKKWTFKYLFVAAFIFYASLYIHRQEALFVVLMVSIMSFYLFIQKHFPSLKKIWEGNGRRIEMSVSKILTDKVNLSFLFTQVMMVSLFVYSYVSMSRHPITKYKLIPLENILPFFSNLYILNPSYQFYSVVTLWGVVVLYLFLQNINKFRNNAFLMAGMLSPFFTVFNPFFTDLFLRHSWGEMLWRMSFLVPLQLVGAYLFVISVQYMWAGSYLKKIYGVLVIAILITLLFPFKTTFIENKYSRILTLKAVPVENSPGQWGDLIEYLNSIEKEKWIITDPVTGYLVTAMTRHFSPRKKFHRVWGGYIEYNSDDYSNNPFDRYVGYLFIINKRNGGMSKTGRVAKHWPEGILQIEKYYYSDKLDDYIRSNPGRFRMLWQKDKIRVYSIEYSRKGAT